MNPTQLLEHFDRLAEAPGAVPRLRSFIRDLAVRGKLVVQDAGDEPATELLKQICSRGQKSLAPKKSNQLISMADAEVETPFAIPQSWTWTRLFKLGLTQTGATPSKNAGEVYGSHLPFLKPSDLLPNLVDYSGQGLSELGLKASGRFTSAGSLLMVCIGTIGKCQSIDRVCSFNQQINSIAPHEGLASRYLLCVFMSEYFQRAAWTASAKTTIAILNKGKWEQLLVPLPPLAEQHRIVAKVDELMALCDQVEAAQQERERRRDRLASASLQRLNHPAVDATPETQRDHAFFHLHHLPRLTTGPEHVKAMRQLFRDLAVRGKLLPQIKSEGMARDALAAAFDVRRLLIKKGQLAQKWLTATAWLDDAPFELPAQWVTASFDQLAAPVANALKAGPFGSALKKEFYATEGYKIYGQEQVIGQDANLGDYYIAEQKYLELQSCAAKPGDLLISLVGTIGKVLILPPGCKAGIINPRLIKLTLNSNVIAAEYVSLLLQAPWVRDFLFAQSHGTTMDVLNLTILRSLPIPVPPLAEQKRIVAKVDELMALCDQLEAELTITQTDSRRLLEAVLEAVLAPA